jgi:hypothetical protein
MTKTCQQPPTLEDEWLLTVSHHIAAKKCMQKAPGVHILANAFTRAWQSTLA